VRLPRSTACATRRVRRATVANTGWSSSAPRYGFATLRSFRTAPTWFLGYMPSAPSHTAHPAPSLWRASALTFGAFALNSSVRLADRVASEVPPWPTGRELERNPCQREGVQVGFSHKAVGSRNLIKWRGIRIYTPCFSGASARRAPSFTPRSFRSLPEGQMRDHAG
jgi:hypothetical protein